MSGRRTRIPLWLWVAAALGSATVLVVAIVGRHHGDGASLRPMAASESMSDGQARAVAENTVRVWDRERLAQHLANVEALTCPDPTPDGILAADLDNVRKHMPPVRISPIVAFGAFTRHGPVWLLNTHRSDSGGVVFELRVRDGELFVCDVGAAPVL
jgi:hypothetical protein